MSDTHNLDLRVNAYRPDLADIALSNPALSAPKADKYIEPAIRQCVRGILPLFAEPHFGAPLISQVRYGEFVDVFEERGDGFAWVQNRMDRYVGYMPYDGALSEEISDLSNRVTVLKTFVYPEPDFKSSPMDELTLASFVKPIGQEREFFELASGGFVFSKHIEPVSASRTKDYAFTAGRLLNVPYLWGGRSSNGIDSSGFVQLALQMADYDLPRDSDQQCEFIGRPLPDHWRDVAWKRGDIVFFAGHVGIMADHANLIHATSTEMQVVVQPLTDVVVKRGDITAMGRPEL